MAFFLLSLSCSKVRGFSVPNHSAIICHPKRSAPTGLSAVKVEMDNPTRQQKEQQASVEEAEKIQTEEEEVPTMMKQAAIRFFFGQDKGPLSVVGILVGFLTWRSSLAEMSAVGLADAFVASLAAVFWCFQEHFLHQKLLHSNFDWYGKEIHRGHHEKSYFHISIDPAYLMVGWLLTAHMVLRHTPGLSLPLAISATLGYASAGLFYEWAHYIVHTKVRPPNDFWKRVRDNHMRHHNVDDQYWFSFSVPAIDDMFGTNPSVKDVRRNRKRIARAATAATSASSSGGVDGSKSSSLRTGVRAIATGKGP